MKAKYPSHDPAYQKRYRSNPEYKRKALAYKRKKYAEDPRVREKAAERARLYYEKNKDAIKAKSRTWDKNNRARKNALKKQYYYGNLKSEQEKRRVYMAIQRIEGSAQKRQRDWRANNRAHANELTRKHHRKMIKGLSDTYVKTLIKRRYHIKNPTSEEIEHRRAIISAKRLKQFFQLHQAAEILCKP